MKQITLILVCFFLSILLGYGSLNAQNLNLTWAKAMGGTNDDYATSIAVDASGNVYTTGYFQGTVDFNPNAGVFNLTSASGSFDIFVSKLDASGNFVWAKAMGGTSDDVASSIAVDASGNVYTTGTFAGTADFDPSVGVANLTSAGGNDIFVSKLDASGNFVWAKAMGGTNDDRGSSIAIDATNNVYTTGRFQGTADFDPSVAGVANLTSAGNFDIFVSKLDASGNFVWAKRMGGTSTSGDYATSIAVDASGNVYTTGYFNAVADFDPNAGVTNLTSAGSSDIFVSKLDASGNFVWAKAMGGTGTDRANSIAVDAANNVYTTGYFNATADFDPSAGVANLTSAGFDDIFVSKLDASGNFVWAKAIGGTSNDFAYSIAIDASNNVYTIGDFIGTVDFDPSPTGVFNLTSANGFFVSKLDASGNFVLAKTVSGTAGMAANSIVVDASSNVYIAGVFQGTVDFDPNAGVFNLTSASFNDIFIAKYNQCPTITISPASLAGGTVGTAYSQTITQTGLTGTPTWSVSVGTLPAGLSIASATGIISGTPTTAGTANFTVSVTNGAGCTQTKVYSIVMPCPTITFGTATATNGTVGTAYSLNAGATTTSGTLAYSVTPALPVGLSINATTGLISGTPTTVTTSATYTVRAQTSATCFTDKAYTFGIGTAACPTITISPTTTLPNPIVGTLYSQAITQTGLTGTVTWSIQSGSLPAGLSFNATTATISGTPTTAVTSLLVQIQATNGTCSAVKPYNITVETPITCPTTITVAPNTIPNATEGTAYNQTLTQTGLTGTVSWSRIAGTLPTGLSISNTGIISGTPTATGTFNFTVRVSQVNCFADKAYTIVVAANPTTSIANTLTGEISVSPNPSKSNFLVNFEKANQGAYEVILFDIYGRELYKQKINNISNILEINATSYPVGMYVLQILHNKEKVSLKLVKE